MEVRRSLEGLRRELGGHLEARRALGGHFEAAWRPLGIHLESRMHLKSSRRVSRASGMPKSSQNARVSTILKGNLEGLEATWNPFGGRLKGTWSPE